VTVVANSALWTGERPPMCSRAKLDDMTRDGCGVTCDEGCADPPLQQAMVRSCVRSCDVKARRPAVPRAMLYRERQRCGSCAEGGCVTSGMTTPRLVRVAEDRRLCARRDP